MQLCDFEFCMISDIAPSYVAIILTLAQQNLLHCTIYPLNAEADRSTYVIMRHFWDCPIFGNARVEDRGFIWTPGVIVVGNAGRNSGGQTWKEHI